ncbi:MAG: alpha/beta hydrolase [Anaerolineales bacterium]
MLNTPHETRFIETNGVRLHVVLAGPENGTPVILLHGFPEFWYGWRQQIPALAAAGYRVIVPDQRGYNLSDAPRGLDAYRIDTLAADVIGLMDALGLEKTYLVGHDWGAAVVWTTALLYPQRIIKMGILNVPHPAVMLKFIGKSPKQMLKSWYIGFFQIPGLADWLMSRNHFAGVIAMLRASGKPSTFSEEDLNEYRKAYANSGGLTGMINWYRALARRRPAMPRDVRVKLPVLILWGRQDVALSAEMAAESAALCDNARLIYFDNATHWVQHDEPEAVNNALLEFFSHPTPPEI